jgi:hydroxypyruvate reductase
VSLPAPRENPVRFLRALFDIAVERAQPEKLIAQNLPPRPAGRTVVIGAGKSAAAMAAALEVAWDGPLEGVVVTRYGHAVPTQCIKVMEASHPVADEAGVAASRAILKAVEGLTADDLVIALISGGGSALMFAPLPGVSFGTKQAIGKALLRSGASIAEINCVRKHLSAVKGGRLLKAAAPARVVTLAISDVVGDDPGTIASGPTVPDRTTQEDARAILEKYSIGVPAEARKVLADPAFESPKPSELKDARAEYRIIASPAQSLAAAANAARDLAVDVIDLGDAIEGEASRFGEELAAKANDLAANQMGKPVLMLSGGELTVTVRNPEGRGGRNTECALAFLAASRGRDGLYGLFADTDGIDGSEDNAGAIVTPALFETAAQEKIDPLMLLRQNRSWDFFDAVGGLLVTGPTRTNVNDFRAVLLI